MAKYSERAGSHIAALNEEGSDMKFARTGRRMALIALLVIAFSGFATGAAQAHTTTIHHGSDYATNDHSHLNVYDVECDNHGVWAEAYDDIGFFVVYDNSGCGGNGVHGDGTNIYLYRLCETNEGCTAWKAA
jgi:hypothetical protein